MSAVPHSVPLDDESRRDLEALMAQTGKTAEEVVRDALALSREHTVATVYDVMKNAGWLDRDPATCSLPADLSTNPAHMEGFGRD